MKLITRSALALVVLIGLATSLQAQAPDVAVRIRPPVPQLPLAGHCFPVQLKNLRNAPVTINAAILSVFDQNCRRVCLARTVINKRVDVCKTLDFRICCQAPLPATYTAYVQVLHSSGRNEEWYYRPKRSSESKSR
jgi:hypothetical protein